LNIVITGVSGYIGKRLLIRLDSLPHIESIIGIDIRPPGIQAKKLIFYARSILTPLQDIFKDKTVDTLIHLAFIVKPSHRRRMVEDVDVNGTRNVLEAFLQAKLKHVLYLSSHTVYGAFRDNPVPITEDYPVRPLPGFQYSEDKVRAEKIILDYCLNHTDIQATILRTCPVIGRYASDSIAAVMLEPPVMLRLKGYDPQLQFVHEDDLVDLLVRLIINPASGIYNVANDGELTYSNIARLAGKKMLVLPEALVRPLLGFSWKLHLQCKSPACGLEMIKYPPLVSTSALKRATGYQFRHTSADAIRDFVESRKSR